MYVNLHFGSIVHFPLKLINNIDIVKKVKEANITKKVSSETNVTRSSMSIVYYSLVALERDENT